MLPAFRPFEATYVGGLFVSVADLNGDGAPEAVITPDAGGGPVVAIYDGAELARGNATQLARYFGIDDPAFRGGARTALGDVNGDGLPEVIVAAGLGGGPRVTIWDGLSTLPGPTPTPVGNLFAFEPEVRDGAFVTAGDLNGDAVADLAFGGGPGGGPRVRVLDGARLQFTDGFEPSGSAFGPGTFDVKGELDPAAQLADFFAYDESARGGVWLGFARDAVGDASLVATSGAGQPGRVRVYPLARLTQANPTPSDGLEAFGGSVLSEGVYVS